MRQFAILIVTVLAMVAVSFVVGSFIGCSDAVAPDAPAGFAGDWQAQNYAASYRIVDGVVFSNPLNYGIWMERASRITAKGDQITITIHNPWNGPNITDHLVFIGTLKGNQIIGTYKMNYITEYVPMTWGRL